MNRMKKLVVSAFAFTMLGTGVLTAQAASVGGGTWNYGVGLTGSFSDYDHDSIDHSSTVRKGAKGHTAYAEKGDWSKARLFEFSGCSFYWNYD